MNGQWTVLVDHASETIVEMDNVGGAARPHNWKDCGQ
jgi:hypothetical protein